MTDIPELDIDEFLEHFGVKGMRWGHRKAIDSAEPRERRHLTPEQKAKIKKAAITTGIIVGTAAIIAGSIYLNKRLDNPLLKTATSSATAAVGKKFAETLVNQEPQSTIHATRGKHHGYTIKANGGLDNPLAEYDKSGFFTSGGVGTSGFARYGDRQEKIAARFNDPEGRKDFAGRIITHDVILPESLAKGANSLDDVISKVWPQLKDPYQELYDYTPDWMKD